MRREYRRNHLATGFQDAESPNEAVSRRCVTERDGYATETENRQRTRTNDGTRPNTC